MTAGRCDEGRVTGLECNGGRVTAPECDRGRVVRSTKYDGGGFT